MNGVNPQRMLASMIAMPVIAWLVTLWTASALPIPEVAQRILQSFYMAYACASAANFYLEKRRVMRYKRGYGKSGSEWQRYDRNASVSKNIIIDLLFILFYSMIYMQPVAAVV